MAMWVLGAVFTGASQNYGSLMFARVFMGAGAPGRALPPAGAAAVSRRCARAPHAEGCGLAEGGARRGRRRGVADDAVGAVRGRRGAAEAEGVLVLAALPVPQRGRGRRCAAPRPLPWLVQAPGNPGRRACAGPACAGSACGRASCAARSFQPAAPAGGGMPPAVRSARVPRLGVLTLESGQGTCTARPRPRLAGGPASGSRPRSACQLRRCSYSRPRSTCAARATSCPLSPVRPRCAPNEPPCGTAGEGLPPQPARVFPTASDRCRCLRFARLCGRRVGRQRQVMAALGRAAAGGRRPAAVTAARAPRRRRRRRAPGRLVGRARVGGAAVARGPRAACASGLLGQHLGVRAGAGAAGRAHVLGPQGAPPRSARALRPRAGGSRPPPGPPRLLRARCCASLRAPPERPMSAGRRRALRSRRRERAWRSRPDARPRRRPRWTS